MNSADAGILQEVAGELEKELQAAKDGGSDKNQLTALVRQLSLLCDESIQSKVVVKNAERLIQEAIKKYGVEF